jgi:hypothetical protein
MPRAVEVYERTAGRSFVSVDDRPAMLLACTPADPFGIDNDCTSEAGHYPIASCGDVVCVHCGKVFWQ